MISIHLRPAQITDAPALANLLHAQNAFATVIAESMEFTTQRVASRLQEAIPERDTILVAEVNNTVVAYGAVRWFPGLILPGPDAYLSELFVLPEFRGMQIGSQILAKLRAEASSRKATRLWCINFRERDSYKRAYYKKSGWEEKDIAVFFQQIP